MLVEQRLLDNSYDKSLKFTWDLYHNYGFNVKLDNTGKTPTKTDEITKIYLDKATISIPTKINNFPKPQNITKVFKNKRFEEFPTKQQEALMRQMQNIPLYTVVNGYNEIVSSSTRKEPVKRAMHKIYKSYFNLSQWESDQGPVSINLFFVSKTDAEDYLKNICLEKPNQVKGLGLGVYSVGLDYVYQLNKMSKPRTQYHIVPNLLELKRASSHKNNKFKGTPIYILDHLNNKESGKVIFFSEKQGHDHLKQLKVNLKGQKFQLKLDSLENFLKKSENENLNKLEKTYFKTSEESEKYLNTLKQTHSTKKEKYIYNVNNHINTKVLVIKNFMSDLVLAVTKGGALINQ